MPRALRYCLIVIALVALAFVAWNGLTRAPRAAEDGAAPQAIAPEATADRENPPEFSAAGGERIETTPQSNAPSVDPAPAAAPESPKVGVASLTARFVDTLGNPWPGVLLFDPQREAVSATSDATGNVALDFPLQAADVTWSGRLIARRATCATKVLRCTLTVSTVTKLGDVVLGPGVDVHGRAIDENQRGIRAKVGLAGVERELVDDGPTRRRGAPQFSRDLAVETGEDGTFVIRGVAPGEWRVWGCGAQTRYGWTDVFTLVEGVDARGLEVLVPALRHEDLITGIVLAPDGSPLPNATLSYSFETASQSSSVVKSTENDGRFRIVVQADDAPYNLSAADPQSRYSEVSVHGVKPGTHDLELRLGEEAPFSILLRGPEGEPVPECTVKVHREVREGHWSERDVVVKAKGEGRFELAAPSSRFRLAIEAQGYSKHETAELDAPAPGSTLEIRLERLRLLRGRVLAGGKPAAGARLRGFKDVGDTVFEVNGFRSLHDAEIGCETTTTDDGSFELRCDSVAKLWIRAELAGFAAAEIGPVSPQDPSALEFELVRGGVIEGVVILPEGADAEGTIVGVSRGDGFVRTLRTGPDGRFRFEGLTPGPWQVLPRAQEVGPNSTTIGITSGSMPIEWSCEVRDGRTTRFDLDLSRP
ncbi:MAG: hypothetical protein NTV21_07470 [Planctomycetota bacterium]|nr:hypothetical protein [Planctomycetota bacterium]